MRLTFDNGHTAEADLVVGANGVRSLVWQYVTDGEGVTYSGTSSLRGIVPTVALPALPDPQQSSSGWGWTRTCCITPSVATAGT